MRPGTVKLLCALLVFAALFAHPVPAAERIVFAHLFEESTAHHQEALWAAVEAEKRTNGRYILEVLGKGTLGSSDTQHMEAVKAGTVDMTVVDTDVGIREEDLERIFSPFEQADSSFARKFEGTGLGLALTREFVELHGGRIWAESEGLGKGSHFRFVIPVSQPPGTSTGSAQS